MMTLTHYGLREWGGALLIAAVLEVGAWALYRYVHPAPGIVLGILALLFFVSVAFFFRNPHRVIPRDPEAILSPADGTVKDVTILSDFDQAPFTGPALRIGIFLSVLNVHLNRAPAAWTLQTKHYREGRYLDARDPNCAKENEAMTLAGTGKLGDFTFSLAVRQISGAIARRIVCPADPGEKYAKGAIYGMIKFGSRTELYLPADGSFTVTVKPGDKVTAGVTVMARRSAPAAEGAAK